MDKPTVDMFIKRLTYEAFDTPASAIDALPANYRPLAEISREYYQAASDKDRRALLLDLTLELLRSPHMQSESEQWHTFAVLSGYLVAEYQLREVPHESNSDPQ